MDKIMTWVMAICALIGGADQLAGNKFGLGRRFEDGFQLLGPTALSMAGLICITPLLSLGLEHTVVPLYRILHLDPGMLGGVLAIDMGGYQLCKELAQDPAIGRYGGIIVGATLGCTITLRFLLEWECWENGKNHYSPKEFLQACACFLWESWQGV